MAGQKFAVGQLVEFEKSATPAFKPIGPYEVLRVQTADDVRLRAYRIKSKAEPFERSVRPRQPARDGDSQASCSEPPMSLTRKAQLRRRGAEPPPLAEPRLKTADRLSVGRAS